MKRTLLLILTLLVFTIGCSKEFFVDTAKQGADIPKFELKDFDGKVASSTDIIDDKPTLFVVAAEWCPHCKVEMPDVEKFYTEYKDKVNIIVVFSSSNSSLDLSKEYYTKNGYTFPAYYDENHTVLRGFGIQGFPFNLKITDKKVDSVLELPVTYNKLVSEFIK